MASLKTSLISSPVIQFGSITSLLPLTILKIQFLVETQATIFFNLISSFPSISSTAILTELLSSLASTTSLLLIPLDLTLLEAKR